MEYMRDKEQSYADVPQRSCFKRNTDPNKLIIVTCAVAQDRDASNLLNPMSKQVHV